MPTKGDTNLFDLIKSLTKQEKIELQKYVFAGKENNLNHTIYKLIDGSEEYDEDALIKKAGIKKERLPEIKNYLYRSILKTLETIHGNNISEIKAAQEISQMMVLGYKGLFKQLQKKINTGITRYTELEDYNNIVTLIQMRDELTFRFLPAGKTAADVDAAFAELTAAIEDLYEMNYYRYIFFKSILPAAAYEKIPFSLEYDQKIKDKKIGAPSQPGSFYQSILFWRAQCRYAMIQRKFELADSLSTQAIKFMEDHPEKVQHIPAYFAYGFYNVRAVGNIYLSNHTKAYSALVWITEYLKTNGTQYQNNIDLSFLSINKMSFFNTIGRFEDVLEIGKQLKKKNESMLESFTEHKHMHSYSMAYAYFGLNDQKNAIKYLNEILQDQKENIQRPDLYSWSLILEIVLFFERNDLLFCESKLRTLERMYKNRNRFGELEKGVISLFRALLNSDKSVAFYAKQKEKFVERATIEPGAISHKRYFDLECWLDSKIENKPYKAVLQERYRASEFKII